MACGGGVRRRRSAAASLAVLAQAAAGVASQAAFPLQPHLVQAGLTGVSRPSVANRTWVEFEQPLSHFAPGATATTFKQRDCIYDKYWSGVSAAGPVLFYTGNESPVDEYVNNTGLMWENAQKLGALLIWAEHRYFGESVPKLPGTPNCLAHLTSEEALADYAMILEVLRAGPPGGPLDRWRAPHSAVIALGGSYGGMLSAWFRMKYPGIVDGAIAASAPIWGGPAVQPRVDGSAAVLSNAAKPIGGAPASCMPNLKAAFVLIHDVAKTSAGRQVISEAMGLCEPLRSPDDAATLLDYLQGPLFNLAEGSYPFPSNYITYATFNGTLSQLPPWPVQELCKNLADDFGVTISGSRSDTVKFDVLAPPISIAVDWDQARGNNYSIESLKQQGGAIRLLARVSEGLQIWYNVTGSQRCVDWHAAAPTSLSASPPPSPSGNARAAPPAVGTAAVEQKVAGRGNNVCSAAHERLDIGTAWGALCCNDGINLVTTSAHGLGADLFWPPTLPRNFTLATVVEGSMGFCAGLSQQGLYGVPDKPDEWGRWMDANYGGKRISSHTNIFFSNGELDPWTAAGVPAPGPTKDLPSEIIAMGGHHLDLFFSTPDDPESVKGVRAREIASIEHWIAQGTAARRPLPGPPMDAASLVV